MSTPRTGPPSATRATPGALALSGACGALAAAGTLGRAAGRPGWARRNHRGRDVDLAGGVALAVGCLAGCVVAPAPPRWRGAACVALGGAALAGWWDDHRAGSAPAAGSVPPAGAAAAAVLTPAPGASPRADKGLRGHLSALRTGRVTTGAVKIVGIGAAGLAAGRLLRDGALGDRPRRGPWDVPVDAALIAGAANAVNLFDLRPGRAFKVAGAAGCLLALRGAPGAALLAGAAGTVPVLLPADLRERTMLGDLGANAVGALLGVAAAAGRTRRERLRLLVGITAVTLASEVVSFSRMIEAAPPLRALDRLGRRP